MKVYRSPSNNNMRLARLKITINVWKRCNFKGPVHSLSCVFHIVRADFIICQTMHLVLVDFKYFAKPLKLAKVSDIFWPAKSQLFLHSDWNLEVSKHAVGLTCFDGFRKVIQISWGQCIFDVHLTPWIWTSRVKTCAPLKPYLNQYSLMKLPVSPFQITKSLKLARTGDISRAACFP